MHRVAVDKEKLTGMERLFYRLSIIRGDLYTQGFAYYFETNFEYFDEDLKDLEATGFNEIADLLREGRRILFGSAPLTAEVVNSALDEYWELQEESPIYDELEDLREEFITKADALEKYRDELGLRENFYLHVSW